VDQQGRRGPGDQQRNPSGPAPGSKRRSPQIRGAALQGRRGSAGGAVEKQRAEKQQWRGEGARGGWAEDAPPAAATQAPGAALFSSDPIHRSALSVSLPNCVDCKLCWWPASISRSISRRSVFSRSISRRSVCSRSPPLFPAWGLTYGARLIQLDAQETPMDA